MAILTLSMPGFQKYAQAKGTEYALPPNSAPLYPNQILCGQIQSYEKSLCKISSVLKNDVIMTQ